MSEVKRYLIQKTPIGTMMKPNPEGNWVDFEDFDRVTAERDAALAENKLLRHDVASYLETVAKVCEMLGVDLDSAKCAEGKPSDVLFGYISSMQQRLTAADKREDAARAFVSRLIESASGQPSIATGYLSDVLDALKPAEGQLNQCDGCQAGIPIVNGTHRMGKPGGYPDMMGCTAKLYKPAEGGGDHIKHYECIGKGGDYTVVAIAQGAGTLKGFNHYVYKNADGVHFVRDPEDFLSRMQVKQ